MLGYPDLVLVRVHFCGKRRPNLDKRRKIVELLGMAYLLFVYITPLVLAT